MPRPQRFPVVADADCGWPPATILVVYRFLLGAIVVFALVGCATEPSPTVRPSAASTFVLTVTNLDGLQANVLIGDRKVATVNCWDPPVTLTPGDPGLPPLPWAVTILDISHAPAVKALGTRTEAGDGLPDTIVIRVDHIESGPIASPAAAPIASCPPAPSAEPLY